MANKPIIPEEAFVDMPFPVNGTDVSDAFDSQHPNTTPDAMNVRTFEAITHRARGGSRPGLSKHINQKVGGLTSEIQHLQIIVDPQAGALSANFTIDPPPGYFMITDPSTNVLEGLLGPAYIRNNNRPIRDGGSGHQHNRNLPVGISKRIPVITWADPEDVAPDTVLSGTQLNAIASDPITALAVAGSFVYTPPAGTNLPTVQENIPLSTAFTPTLTASYTNNSKTVHIDVVEPGAVTHIVEVDTSGVISHQSLTASGKTAAAWVGKNASNVTIPGTIELTTPAGFGYSPVFGDVPDLAYGMSFTPDDQETYDPSTKTGIISVAIMFYTANGIISSTDGMDTDGRIIDVEITEIVSSNLAVPANFKDVGAVVTAHRNVAAGSGNPDSANVGNPAGLSYDPETEKWLYNWQPS